MFIFLKVFKKNFSEQEKEYSNIINLFKYVIFKYLLTLTLKLSENLVKR